jgi:hypothetical protein
VTLDSNHSSFPETPPQRANPTHIYAWGNNPRRAALKGRPCRIVARGSRLRSVLIEFENGERVVTSERAVRANPTGGGR